MYRTDRPASPGRRRVIQGMGATATALAARAAFPGGVWAATADAPETTKAVFGFIALTDASPLIVAREKGFFAKAGLPDVVVKKEASWGTTRDNLELGSAGGGIDGAHILTPLPYLLATGKVGKNGQKTPMAILARLNLDGQCISVASAYKEMKVGLDGSPLKEAFAAAKAAGKEVKCAMTFPGGTHDLWIRYWLAASGVDPDQDIALIVVPPAQMVANMKVGSMEAFCVGEPWNAQLVNQKFGFTALTTGELWNGHPEKSLGMRADWVEKHPKAARAVTMAVQQAAMWCEQPANKAEMCEIVGRREWFKVPVEDILGRSRGAFDYGDGRKVEDSPHRMKFWNGHASFPFKSHDAWFLTEHVRWGMLAPDVDRQALIDEVNREDVWRDAAKALGVPAAEVPASSSRGKEAFFDGKVFDPAEPETYLASLSIKRPMA